MSQPVIKVQDLSKEYIIGRQQKGQETFRELVAGAVAAPFQRLRKMRGDVAPEERFWALQDVNFEVQPGEVVGIIGRNGAGKSSLLKILARITEPTRGTVRIRGRVASLLEVGTGFHPELTGRENIFLNGAILGMSRRDIQSKFDEIVAFAETEQFLDTPVKRYSSGMYVRLAFAVAAHLEPDVLVIDEVLAVGDSSFQKKCLRKVEEFAQKKYTVIMVSHNLVAVNALCQKAILLDGGRVISQGPTSQIVNEYHQRAEKDVPVTIVPATRNLSSPIQILKIEMRGTAGPSRRFDSAKPIGVHIGFALTRFYQDDAFIALQILTATGQPVITSTCIDAPGTQSIKSRVGEKISGECVASVPADFLNLGLYELRVAVCDSVGNVVDHVSEIEFEIIQTSAWVTKMFSVERQGIVLAQLQWRFEPSKD